MGTEIADRNNPAQQMSVNEDGSINSNLQDGDGNIVSSAAPLPVSMDSDIQIGAVEIKDGETDTRAKVKSDGTDNALVTVTNIANDFEGQGKLTVNTTPIALVFSGTTKTVKITASMDNTGIIYVGKINVASDGSNSFEELYPGQVLILDYDDATNPIYVVGSTNGQVYIPGALK